MYVGVVYVGVRYVSWTCFSVVYPVVVYLFPISVCARVNVHMSICYSVCTYTAILAQARCYQSYS